VQKTIIPIVTIGVDLLGLMSFIGITLSPYPVLPNPPSPRSVLSRDETSLASSGKNLLGIS
jgi:hypothetical protein